MAYQAMVIPCAVAGGSVRTRLATGTYQPNAMGASNSIVTTLPPISTRLAGTAPSRPAR